MANTIQLRRGTSDVTGVGESGATAANTGEPVVYLPSSGDQKFYIAKSGTAGDFIWMGAPITTDETSSSATKLMTASAIQAAIDLEDTLAEMGDTDISSLASGHILVYDGSDSFDNVAVSGDATLAANGALTIGSQKITNAMLADDAVGADELAANAVVSASIVDGTIATGDIADNAITAAKFNISGDGTSGQIIQSDGDGSFSYTSAASANDATITLTAGNGLKTGGNFTTNQSSDETITFTIDLSDAGLTTATSIAQDDLLAFADEDATNDETKNITFSNIEDTIFGNVSGDVSIAAGGAATLASNSVSQAQLDDDAVGADELAANAVVTASIVDANVTAAKLASNAVTTAKITDANVTTAKIANDAVTGAKLANDITIANDLTVSNDLAVSGNLTVTGTTTTVNQTNLDVSDNIIGLNRGAGSNANDSGLIIERGSTGDNAAIIWDESADGFIMGTTTATPSGTGDLTVSKGNLVLNDLDVDGTLEADAITVGGATLQVVVEDHVGAMLDGTETGITVSYDSTNNNLDFVIGAGDIVHSMLADDACDADNLAANAVVTASIVDDAVTAAKLASNAVVNASIASGAAIDMDKLDGDSLATTITDFAQDDLVILSDTSDSGNLVNITASNFEDAIFGNVTGDATIAAGGALTIAATSVENGMLAGSIANAKLANSTISGVSLGSNLNNITVDDATIKLNSGTTFNGSAARTISAKTAAIADGGAALATADQIHTFVSGFNIDGGSL